MRPLHPLNIKRTDNIRLLVVRIVTEIDVTKELDKNRGEARVRDKGEAQGKLDHFVEEAFLLSFSSEVGKEDLDQEKEASDHGNEVGPDS